MQSHYRSLEQAGTLGVLARLWRTLIVGVLALLALLSATVAIGQSSNDFDLACRGILASGGRVVESGDFAMTGTLGVPIVPPKDSATAPTYAVRSNNYGVRAGFLPAYPNGQRAAVAGTAQESAPAYSEQQMVQRLPIIEKFVRIVRGGC
jgi:hypothetical protein